MSFCWRPPWSGIEPGGWNDGDGFVSPAVQEGLGFKVLKGTQAIAIGQDKVTVVFAEPLPLGTEYEVFPSVQNLDDEDPVEHIFPTTIISKDNDGDDEIGFTFGLNAAPTVSTFQFRWTINYYL